MSEEMVLTGTSAPPMANGEIVFESPWQSRAFGMARTLCENGLYTWDEFREKLIEEIEANTVDENYQYFDHFLAALTRLLGEKDLCQAGELEARSGQLAARPHGHDH